MQKNVGIVGVGCYLPQSRVSSDDLGRAVGVDGDWIVDRTRIAERRVADPQEATSDLAAQAAGEALRHAGLTAADVDLIVLATSTPDWIQPATACAVQAKLAARSAAAFDVSAVCSGFVYALSVAWSLVRTHEQFDRALVIGAETYSRILDYRDRDSSVLFGDGGGAVVLGPTSRAGILDIQLGSDGSKADLVGISAGGSRAPTSDATLARREHFFHMDGRAVKRFVRSTIPRAIEDALDAVGMELDEIDLVIPHQANGVLLDECLTGIGVAPERIHYTLERYGNTGGASVPVTLADAVERGRLSDGDTVLLVGFGGGMTWGTAVLRWLAPEGSREETTS